MFLDSRVAGAVLLSAVLVIATVPVHAAPSLGLPISIVSDKAELGSVGLVENKRAATIFIDKADWAGVFRGCF